MHRDLISPSRAGPRQLLSENHGEQNEHAESEDTRCKYAGQRTAEGWFLCAEAPHVVPVICGPKQKRHDSRGYDEHGELSHSYEEIWRCLIDAKLNLEKLVDCEPKRDQRRCGSDPRHHGAVIGHAGAFEGQSGLRINWRNGCRWLWCCFHSRHHDSSHRLQARTTFQLFVQDRYAEIERLNSVNDAELEHLLCEVHSGSSEDVGDKRLCVGMFRAD